MFTSSAHYRRAPIARVQHMLSLQYGSPPLEPLMFAVGGDLGGNETTKITTREAARHVFFRFALFAL